MSRLTVHSENRPKQVRAILNGVGFRGITVKGRALTGVPGWRFVVTAQDGNRAGGESIWVQLLRLNREERTVIVRAKAMTTVPAPRIGDSQVLVRLEDFIELLVFKHEHEKKE